MSQSSERGMPLVVCTIGNPGLALLQVSASLYAPECALRVFRLPPSTFGEAYNAAMSETFNGAKEALIANDDIVLGPTTIKTLLDDVAALKASYGERLGLVGVWSDEIRGAQSIRSGTPAVVEIERLSPVLAWVPRRAWAIAQFPPLNWYSDDVFCEDLRRAGFRHFLSRAYVHHAGSQTIGTDAYRHHAESLPWLQANRPQYLKQWFQ